MMRMNRKNKPAHALFAQSALVAAIAAACSPAAMAIEIDAGNPDVKIRWDNTVRYNLGMRAEAQDSRILRGIPYDESDSKFDKHDIVTNRLDLLSELDLSYADKIGVRVSGAAWHDEAYGLHSHSNPNPPLSNMPSYPDRKSVV